MTREEIVKKIDGLSTQQFDGITYLRADMDEISDFILSILKEKEYYIASLEDASIVK